MNCPACNCPLSRVVGMVRGMRGECQRRECSHCGKQFIAAVNQVQIQFSAPPKCIRCGGRCNVTNTYDSYRRVVCSACGLAFKEPGKPV